MEVNETWEELSPPPPPPAPLKPNIGPPFVWSVIANENYVIAWLPIAGRTSRGESSASIARDHCCTCACFGCFGGQRRSDACPFAFFSLQTQRSLSLLFFLLVDRRRAALWCLVLTWSTFNSAASVWICSCALLSNLCDRSSMSSFKVRTAPRPSRNCINDDLRAAQAQPTHIRFDDTSFPCSFVEGKVIWPSASTFLAVADEDNLSSLLQVLGVNYRIIWVGVVTAKLSEEDAGHPSSCKFFFCPIHTQKKKKKNVFLIARGSSPDKVIIFPA